MRQANTNINDFDRVPLLYRHKILQPNFLQISSQSTCNFDYDAA
jgi:hypothetical protein